MQFHASANFQKPGRPNPGAKCVFEGMKHLQNKLVCKGKSKKVDAIDILKVRLSQTILRYFNLYPWALFED
jgi:hypothetical protein